MKKGTKIGRREFAGLMVVGAAAACSDGDSADGGDAQPVIHLDEVVEGTPVDFRFPGPRNAAFVVKLGAPAEGGVGPDGDIVAFQRACPHMGCPIPEVNAAKGTLGPCPCHLSLFDLRRSGVQIRGRASQNLVQVELEVLPDGTLCAVGLSGLTFGEALTEDLAESPNGDPV